MSLQFVISQPEDVESIYQYAFNQLKLNNDNQLSPKNEFDLMIEVWNSLFRKESLEHYCKLGWSFIAKEAVNINSGSLKEAPLVPNQIRGYFLAQPILFFQGQTQTLYVEDVVADTPQLVEDLIEIAYKLARDKHFQKVILPKKFSTALQNKKISVLNLDSDLIWVKTTK